MADTPEKAALKAPPQAPYNLGGDLLTQKGANAPAPSPEAYVNAHRGKLDFTVTPIYPKEVTEQPPAPAAPAEAKLHVVNQGADAQTAGLVQNALDKLPPKLKQFFESQGVEVYTFKNISEYDKFFHTNDAQKVIDGNRLAADNVAGLNEPNAKPPRIAIFQNTMRGKKIADIEDIGGITRHELGHVFTNQIMPDFTKPDGGAHFDSQLAQQLYLDGDTVPVDLKKTTLSHYFHGPAEIYAETFAMATGGGSNAVEDQLIGTYFKKSLDIIRAKYAQ